MKVLILIDSFKGSISSSTLGKLMQESLSEVNIESQYFPISDGGDGFLDAIENIVDTKREYLHVHDPLGKVINTYYLTNSNTAYIEVAKASGLTLVDKLKPDKANTYGFGELILDAVNKGYKKIILGIGGSATNDAGAGMLEALGVKFYDDANQEIKAIIPESLAKITKINHEGLTNKIKDINFTVLSDVNNPLLGENGATKVYGPQKGIKRDELNLYEEKINHFARMVTSVIGKDLTSYPGSGAAGGTGFSLKAFFEPTFTSGANFLLDLLRYKTIEKNYDYIITGEAKIDQQSLSGKVVSSILNNTDSKKVIIVCAVNELTIDKYKIFSITPSLATKEESLNNPVETYKKLTKEVAKNLSLENENFK